MKRNTENWPISHNRVAGNHTSAASTRALGDVLTCARKHAWSLKRSLMMKTERSWTKSSKRSVADAARWSQLDDQQRLTAGADIGMKSNGRGKDTQIPAPTNQEAKRQDQSPAGAEREDPSPRGKGDHHPPRLGLRMGVLPEHKVRGKLQQRGQMQRARVRALQGQRGKI